MANINVTVEGFGEAYVALVAGEAPEVRDSVALDALEEAGRSPRSTASCSTSITTGGSSG